jgi:hypothetical protein
MPLIRESYADLDKAAAGADLIVSHMLTYAAPVLAEKKGLRWLSVSLQPLMFFSAHDPPVLAPAPWLSALRPLGPRVNGPLLRLLKRFSYSWGDPVRALREDLPHRLIVGGAQDVQIVRQRQRQGRRGARRGGGFPNAGADVGFQDGDEHGRDHRGAGVEQRRASGVRRGGLQGGWVWYRAPHRAGVRPQGWSSRVDGATRLGGLEQAQDGFHDAFFLEQPFDPRVERGAAGRADLRRRRRVVGRGRGGRGIRLQCGRQRQRGEALQNLPGQGGRKGALAEGFGLVLPLVAAGCAVHSRPDDVRAQAAWRQVEEC